MALPTNFSRPTTIPYIPLQSLANNDRYTTVNALKKPVDSQAVEGDFNCLTDYVNILARAINELIVGLVPGSDDLINANKILTTNGQGSVSWILVQNQNIDNDAISSRNIINEAITADKISNDAITTDKIAINAITSDKINVAAVTTSKIAVNAVTGPRIGNNAVTESKIDNNAVTESKIDNNAVTESKINNAAVTSSKIANNAVTADKIASKAVRVSNIDAQNASLNTVLTATGSGNAAFLPNIDRILQIKNTTSRDITFTPITGSSTFASFGNPFALSITPRSLTSKILLFISANLYAANGISGTNQNYVAGLFRNNTLWQQATGTSQNGAIPGLFGGVTIRPGDLENHSAFILDNLSRSSYATIQYELKCYNSTSSANESYVLLNVAYGTTNETVLGVGAISSIIAVEIELT